MIRNNEELIIECKKIHGEKYDYSKSFFNGSKSKINIICEKHGEFKKIIYDHINKKQGCPKCYYEKNTKTNEQFIIEANKVHNNLYEYRSDYINDKTNINIECKKHGIFKQTPNNHLKGNGCPKCNGGVLKDNNYFIKKSNLVHNYKYQYIEEYVNSITAIKINCSIHGIFEQKPHEHLLGRGCPKCSGKNKSHEDFLKIVNKIHNNKYEYLNEYKGSKHYLNIKCPKHGIFRQLADSHMRGNGCPNCKNSKGENLIFDYLKNKNIFFYKDKSFEDCNYKRKLKFDFYLPEYNMCIEFDGIQHFKPIDVFGGIKILKENKIRDQIKNDYCKVNKINLIRIKYDDNINVILDKVLI